MARSADALRGSRLFWASLLGVMALAAPVFAAPPQFAYENNFVGKWGSSGSQDGQFTQPYNVARNSEGDIFVVEVSNSRVQKFDAEGQFISKFGTFGMGDGQFMSPSGIAINGSDEIHVVDFNQNNVQQFDADGVFIRKWGTGGAANGQFQNPHSLAVDSSGNVYVADYGNDRIQVFEGDGDFIRTFGSTGSGNGQLSFPDGIAVDGSGNVFVSDRNNDRVQVFDSTGAFVRLWGGTGSADGQFENPSGLALGADGIVYVGDYDNNNVQAFTPEGTFLGKWGTTGGGDGQFQGPSGVAVTPEGRVYVTNFSGGFGNRVQYFDPIWKVTMDEDGDPTDFALTLSAFDGDADTITWSISGPATNGAAAATGTGTSKFIGYTPNANYNGSDNFTVQINDGNAGTATRTVSVSINPVADAPTIDQGVGPIPVTMSQDGAPLPFVAPTVSATEPDGDTILWSVSSAASHGTATVSGSGASPSTFTYVPTGGYTGSDAFTIQASDGVLSDTIVVEVTIAPAAESPVITQGAGPLAVSMDEEGTFTAPTLGATDGDTGTGSLTWSVSSPATSGSADVSGMGASPSTFTYAPATDFEGSDSFTVQVSDGVLTDTIVVNVTVNNVNDDPMIFQGDGPLFVTMSEDSSPTDFVRPTLYATDVDGDTLTWSVAAQGADGTASVSGTGSSATVLDFTPNANYNGEDSFYVQVSDGTAPDVIEIKVTINPVNDAPEITQGAGPITTEYNQGGDSSGFQTPGIGASDVDNDGDDLVWSVLTQAGHGTATVSGSGMVPEVFTYVADPQYLGQDTFEIQVSDGSLTDTISVVVTMNDVNDDPVITQGDGPLSVEMDEDGSPRAFVMPALDATDVDGDSLTWSVVAQGVDGTATVSGSGASPATMTFVPNENYVGVDQFTVQVADGRGGVDNIVVALTIEAVNDAPTIDQGGPVEATMDEDGSFEAPGLSASDVDGDTLTWSIATQPDHGTAAMSGMGGTPEVFTYTPEEDFNGDDSFEVEVSDGTLSATVTVNVTVSPTNDAPDVSSTGTTITMNEDGASPDFSVLAITASDRDSDIGDLTWSVSVQGEKGTAGVSPAGASPLIVYVPALNQNGSDEFTLAVSDGAGGVAEVTLAVTIAPQPDAPIIAQGDSAAGIHTRQGTASGFSAPSITASDPDGDTLAWSLQTQATHGVAEVSGSGASPTLLDYAPEAEFLGADSFVVAVSDENGGTDTITINVTAILQNDAPVIVQGAGPIALAMNEGADFVAPLVSATDGDSDTLTWTIGTAPAHGEAEVSGEGASPETLHYTPEAAYFGRDSFTVIVSDGNGGSDTIEIAITIVEVFNPPTIDQGAGPMTVAMDEDGVPTAFVAPELSASDSDSEASVLVWSLASPPAHGTATVSGSGASPGVLTYAPTAHYNGADSFTVNVADAEGGSDTVVVAVTVSAINDLPDIAEARSFRLADEWDLALPADTVLTRLPLAIGADGKVYTGGESGIRIYSGEGVFERTLASFVADSLAVAADGTVFAGQMHPPVLKKFTSDGAEVAGWPTATNLFPGFYTIGGWLGNYEVPLKQYLRSLTTAPDGGVYISQSTESFSPDWNSVAWRQLDSVGNLVYSSHGAYQDATAKFVQTRIAHAVDASNRVYVWDDAVRIFNADRSLAREFAGPQVGGTTPKLVAASPNGESVYLAAANAAEVEVRGANGTILGKVGTGSISALATAAERLYVSNHGDARVRVFELNTSTDLVSATVLEDQRFSFRTSAVDADGQPLIWSVSTPPESGVAAVTAASGSTQSEVSFSPAANFIGEVAFSVGVSDGNGGLDTLQFELTVISVNDAPIIEQGAGPIDVAMDEDGTPVSFVAPELNGVDIEDEFVTWSLGSGPSHGTAVIAGEGESPETFSYVPAANFNGTDQFTVRATDAEGVFTATTIRVTVRPINDAPDVGEYLDYQVAGSWAIDLPEGTAALGVLAIALAPDGDIYATTGTSIEVYGPTGEHKRSISFAGALGLGVDAAGNIYVAVGGAPYLRKLTSNGQLDATWSPGDLFPASMTSGSIFGPTTIPLNHQVERIAVLPSGAIRFAQLVYFANGGGTLRINLRALNPTGGLEFSKEYAPEYERTGSLIVTGSPFNNRYAVAATSGGNTFVRKQETISSFDSRYLYLRRAEKIVSYNLTGSDTGNVEINGLGHGALNRELAVHPDGRYLAASDGGRVGVDVHNRSGRTVSQFGGSGSAAGQMQTVSGLAMDPSGRIYVADRLNLRIQYFDVVPDSDVVTVFVNEGWDFDLPLNAVDVDGDTVTWTVIAEPEHGTLVVGTTLRYTANADFEGRDSLEVQASDGRGGTLTRVVNIIINPVQDVPVIDQGAGPIAVITDKNKPFNQAAITATDPDSADVLTWTVITGPGNGAIQRTGTDTSSYAFTYTPRKDYVGRDSIRLRVADGKGGEDSIEIAITVRDVVDGDTGGSTPEENAARLRTGFALVDANQDGKASLAEVQAVYPEITQAQFDELDLDSDGFLTEEELDGVDPPTGCNNPGDAKAFAETLIGKLIGAIREGLATFIGG